jgi:MFS family permease
VAVAAYVVAVLHRTSFGVAGIAAAERYRVSSATLAGFTVLQLVMSAGLQVPVGVALDRFGCRRLIAAGGLVMAAGQLVLATSTSVPTAYLGRALVGTGDAATFISVLTQLTGLIGQFGQVLSAVPLVALLHGPGWTPAFVSVAALGVLVSVLGAAVIRNGPDPVPAPSEPSLRRVAADLRSAWRHPGTRLGLWTHFTAQFPGTVFALAWGYPFLVAGEGVDPRVASGLLTLFVLAGVAAGPVTGCWWPGTRCAGPGWCSASSG